MLGTIKTPAWPEQTGDSDHICKQEAKIWHANSKGSDWGEMDLMTMEIMIQCLQ